MTAPTPKQRLVSHLAEHHRRVKVTTRDTAASLGSKHAREHWRYGSHSHLHAGPQNLGPDARPPGWRTGGDVVRLDERGWPEMPLDENGWPREEKG